MFVQIFKKDSKLEIEHVGMGTCRIADTCPLIGESGFLKINFFNYNTFVQK